MRRKKSMRKKISEIINDCSFCAGGFSLNEKDSLEATDKILKLVEISMKKELRDALKFGLM